MIWAQPVRKPERTAPAAGARISVSRAQRPNPHLVHAVLQRNAACAAGAPAGACRSRAEDESGFQRKLSVGSSSDPLEREADRIADEVHARPGAPAIASAPVSVRRFSGAPNATTNAAPPSVEHALAGAGQPLDRATRSGMGQRFGHDFSSVRIHDDGAARQSARDVGAQAYTVGNHIVFAAGRFAPETNDGRRLIAHELTHVVQQEGASRRTLRAKADKEMVPVAKLPDRADLKKAMEAVDHWERDFSLALARFQLWALRNTFRFQADWLTSDKGNAQIKNIEGGISAKIAETVLSQMVTTGIEGLAKQAAAASFSKLFLATGTAAALGNVFSVAVAMVVSAITDAIKDTSSQLVRYTVGAVAPWAMKISSAVDAQRVAQQARTQKLRQDLLFGDLPLKDLASRQQALLESANGLRGAFQNSSDLSLYHRLALTQEVVSPRETVSADAEPLEVVAGAGEKLAFVIERDWATNGPLRAAPYKLNTVVVGIHGYFCDAKHGDLTPWNVDTPDTNPALKGDDLPRTYNVTLWSENNTGQVKYPARSFRVGYKEYGTWYNVPEGQYRLSVFRDANQHPVGLCGIGDFKVAKAG